MVHDPDEGVGGGELVGDLPRGVGRGIVDHDQLVGGQLASFDQLTADDPGGVDRREDVLLLVVHREEDREGRRRNGHRTGHAIRRSAPGSRAAAPLPSGRHGADAAPTRPDGTIRRRRAADAGGRRGAVLGRPVHGRPGQLTTGWRWVLVLGWAAIVIGLMAVGGAGDVLGKPPWWLDGALVVVPFVVPVLALVAAYMNADGRSGWAWWASPRWR